MSRNLSTINTAQVDSSHVHLVTMVKMEFDTPLYTHSDVGTINWGGNDYLGVGGYGGISSTKETEILGPSSITLTLSGVDSDYIAEALDSGNLFDKITIYQAYRQDDGTIYDDPWTVWKGWFDSSAIAMDAESSVSITCQHDLSMLNEKVGSRYSDEDQQNRYSGDVGLEFTSDAQGLKLLWAGGPVPTGGRGGTLIPGDNGGELP